MLLLLRCNYKTLFKNIWSQICLTLLKSLNNNINIVITIKYTHELFSQIVHKVSNLKPIKYMMVTIWVEYVILQFDVVGTQIKKNNYKTARAQLIYKHLNGFTFSILNINNIYILTALSFTQGHTLIYTHTNIYTSSTFLHIDIYWWVCVFECIFMWDFLAGRMGVVQFNVYIVFVFLFHLNNCCFVITTILLETVF